MHMHIFMHMHIVMHMHICYAYSYFYAYAYFDAMMILYKQVGFLLLFTHKEKGECQLKLCFDVTARDDYCVLLHPRIISQFSLQHCHFIDEPLTLEDTSEFQAHKIVLSLGSDQGQFIFLDCFFDMFTFC